MNGCWVSSVGGRSQLSLMISAQTSEIVLAADRHLLGTDNELASTIQNVLDLADQKRFSEASGLLEKLRSTLAINSEGFQSVTASMALLALRSGDFKRFEQFAGQLDRSLEDPLRVEPAFADVITLYRVVNGKSLPVNATNSLRRLESLGVVTDVASR